MIECDCSVDIDEYSAVCLERIVTARKQHECCECGEPIRPGERHEVAESLFDGRWSRFRTCAPCLAIRERYCPHGWEWGHLAEDIEDCIGFDYREVPEDDDDP